MDLIINRWGATYRGRPFPCAIGRGGIIPASDKREGDGASPAGSWQIEYGWYRADRIARPSTGISLRASGHRDGWCDDPQSADYNDVVRLPIKESFELMRRGDMLYDLVLVLDHNRPAVPNAGSAIFVHCWRGPRRPTAGCIAFARQDLIDIVGRWDPIRDRLIIR